jgi:flagellar hook assembly protein FlgD
VKSLILSVCLLSAGVVGAAPLGMVVEVPSAQFHLGQGAAIFVVHGPSQSRLQAAVLDANEHKIASLQPVGADTLQWDGRDHEGRWVRPGTYYVEIVEEPYLWDGAVIVNP